MLIRPGSLSQTVDAINAASYERAVLSAHDRKAAAHWIVGRQGLPASARHILGEESCRVLRLLAVRDDKVGVALERAEAGLMRSLERAALDPRNTNPGLFCCGKCSVGLWRNLLAGGMNRQEERLRRGVGHLRSMRVGEGQWRRFPYWYTVLALSEMDIPEASNELKYAAPALALAAKRTPNSATSARRRHELAKRVLERT